MPNHQHMSAAPQELAFAQSVSKGSPHSLASGCTCGVCRYPLDTQPLLEHKPTNTLMAICSECGRATVCDPMPGTTLGRQQEPKRLLVASIAMFLTGAVIGPILLILLIAFLQFIF